MHVVREILFPGTSGRKREPSDGRRKAGTDASRVKGEVEPSRPEVRSFDSSDEFSVEHWMKVRRAVRENSPDGGDFDCADWT